MNKKIDFIRMRLKHFNNINLRSNCDLEYAVLMRRKQGLSLNLQLHFFKIKNYTKREYISNMNQIIILYNIYEFDCY